jgi:hypothetical protein
VAEIVKPDEREACGLQGGPKVTPEHIPVVDVIPGLVGEYQSQIIFRAGPPPLLSILPCHEFINLPLVILVKKKYWVGSFTPTTALNIYTRGILRCA